MRVGIDSQQKTFLDISKVWRPIHYLGSKLRLTGMICELLDDLADGPVCDLFAGSGTVSFCLSRSRDVVAADIQEYSRVICTALLRPTSTKDQDVTHLLNRAAQNRSKFEALLEPILEYEQLAIDRSDSQPGLLCDLVEHGSLITGNVTGALGTALNAARTRLKKADAPLLCTRYFGGRYFSFRQAIFIDSLLDDVDGETCLAALLSTASTIVNSIGKQFAQPMRPRRNDGTIKTHLIRQMCRDRCQDAGQVFSNWLARYRSITQERPHRVLRGDYREILAEPKDFGVIYADPPYTRDHYSRFYHVLETLCLRDSPDLSKTFLRGPTSHGLYRIDRHQSPFCIKSQAPGAFAELFAGAEGLPMLLSYSPFVRDGHPRMMTVDAIAELAKKHYGTVKVVSASFAHSKLNKSRFHREAADNGEVLIACC